MKPEIKKAPITVIKLSLNYSPISECNTCIADIVCTPPLRLGGGVGILEFCVFGGGQNIFDFRGGCPMRGGGVHSLSIL